MSVESGELNYCRKEEVKQRHISTYLTFELFTSCFKGVLDSFLNSSVATCNTSMPVTLDNIQFYDGPSKPRKPLHHAFSSSGYCTGVFSSSERPFSCQTTVCSMTSRSSASHANYQKHQQTAALPNEFDMELRKSLEEDVPHLANDDALEGASCDSLPAFNITHQGDLDRDVSLDSPFLKTVDRACEPGHTCPSKFPSPVRTSASNPPFIETYSVVQSDSENLIGDANQSTEREVAQQREETFPSSLPSTIDESVLSDVSNSVCGRSTETSLSFRSISPVSETSKEDLFLSLASKDHSKEKPDTHQYAGQETMRNSDSCSVTTTLPRSPEQVTSEQADAAEAIDPKSPARSKSPCIPGEPTKTSPKKRKTKNEGEKTSGKLCQGGKYSSFAVVIPALRSRPTSAQPSSPAVSSDMSLSGDSERSEDSSDENYTRDNSLSQLSDKESIETLGCKHTRIGTTASYEFQGSRDGLLDCRNTSRDIIGRAILTIESEGSKPTFFLTLVPEDNPSPSHPSTNYTHEAMAPSRKQKQSVKKSRHSQAKRERRRYLPDEDYLLVNLKEREKLAWDEIAAHFPSRTSSSLQVHYSTKLKHRSTGQPRLRTEKRKRKRK